MEKVLIVEDNVMLLNALGEQLRRAGYSAIPAEDGLSGLKSFYSEHPDLVVLDIWLPQMDGWTVASRIREVSRVPLIVHTGIKSEEDKLRAFSLGVDDFVMKPVSFAELVARVKAVLRRANDNGATKSTFTTSGDLTIDFTQRCVTRNGEGIHLTPTEFRLLAVLARHKGRPVSHEHLLAEVWGPGYEGETCHIKRYVWSLRKKLEEDPSSPRHLLTEIGFGYRFE